MSLNDLLTKARSNTHSAKPTMEPTTHDIAWTAGIWKGEGNIYFHNGHLRATVSQIGGIIYEHNKKLNDHKSFVWYIGGRDAHGFILTIFTFLSPHRKEQVMKYLKLAGWVK